MFCHYIKKIICPLSGHTQICNRFFFAHFPSSQPVSLTSICFVTILAKTKNDQKHILMLVMVKKTPRTNAYNMRTLYSFSDSRIFRNWASCGSDGKDGRRVIQLSEGGHSTCHVKALTIQYKTIQFTLRCTQVRHW